MVTEWFLGVVASVLSWVATLMPTISLPAFLTGSGPGTLVGTVSAGVASLGMVDAWLPVSAIAAGVTLVTAALAVAAVVKLVRITASFFTAGGGSAA